MDDISCTKCKVYLNEIKRLHAELEMLKSQIHNNKPVTNVVWMDDNMVNINYNNKMF